MFKNKTIKLFLMLGVIFFSLVGVVGCSTKNNTKTINASYIETFFENSNDVNDQFDIIENQADLVMLLKNDTPKKYNDSFFETNSLLVFKIVESSLKDKSEIGGGEIIPIITTPSPAATASPTTTSSPITLVSPNTTASPSTGKLPQTGIGDSPVPILFGALVLTLVSYIAYRRYKDI